MDNTLLIFTTAAVTSLVGEASEINKSSSHHPTMKPVLGGFVMGVFLFAINLLNANLCHALCILISIAAIVVDGKPLLSMLGGLT